MVKQFVLKLLRNSSNFAAGYDKQRSHCSTHIFFKTCARFAIFSLPFPFQEDCLHYITAHPEVMDSDVFQELPSDLKQEIMDKVRQNM